MFSSLKLNSLKCQSNSSSDDKTNNEEDVAGDSVSDHMYEKIPSFEIKTCKCHLENIKKSPKSGKIPLSKRISKWRMECPSITDIRSISPSNEQESKNNHDERINGIFNFECTNGVKSKVMTVNIERENGNLGITLRGGFHQKADLSRPVTITYVKPDGPAAKQGTIKPGDRLLAVDGISLHGSTLNDAQTLLKQPSSTTLLTIEYDVNILNSVEHAHGPLLIEIEKSCSQQLGLTLLQNDDGIVIERVKPGSLADRCGALHIGDKILAVNATRINGLSVALEDVMKILECEYPIVRLEILPFYTLSNYSNCGTWKTRDLFGALSTGVNPSKGNYTNRKNYDLNKEEKESSSECKIDIANTPSMCNAETALTHVETLHTTLSRENGNFGLQFIDAPDGNVLINSISHGGPAERSQCLHPGDRVSAVNHRSVTIENLKAKDINELLEFKVDGSSCSVLNLQTEFDVLYPTLPSSGVFFVKLIKRGSTELGITMMGSKTSGFIVCEVKKGSIAYRAGSLIPGDRLLAINDIPLDECSIEHATHIFHQSTNVVTLKVQRDEANKDFRSCNRKITYTVDLQRYGGPLGITIAGSEEPSHPITISGLTVGGLAEQTGVIHVGDEILAINNHSLSGEPLSKAHGLLQNSSDLVTLKLSRPLIPICRISNNRSPILLSSIDSAVESWDSSHLDLAPSPDQQKPNREWRSKTSNFVVDCDLHPIMKPTHCMYEDDRKHYSNGSLTWQSLETVYSKERNNYPDTTLVQGFRPQNTDLAILDEITSENLKIKHELDMLSIKLDEQRKSKMTQSENKLNIPLTENPWGVQKENSVKNNQTLPRSKNLSSKGTPNITNATETELYSGASSRKVEESEAEPEVKQTIAASSNEKLETCYLPEARNWCKNQYFDYSSGQDSIRSEFQSFQLYEVTLYKDPVYEDFGFSVSDGLYERGVFINRIRKGGPADLSNVLKPYDRILQVNNTYTQDFDCCLTVPLIASAGSSLVLLVARNPNTCDSENVFSNEKIPKKEINISANKVNGQQPEELRRIIV